MRPGLLIIFLVFALGGCFWLTKRSFYILIPMLIGLIYLCSIGYQIQYLRYFLPGILLITVSLVLTFQSKFSPKSFFWIPIFLALTIVNLYAIPSSRIFNGLIYVPFKERFSLGFKNGIPSLNFEENTINDTQYISGVLNAYARKIPVTLMLGCPFGAPYNGKILYTEWHNMSWAMKGDDIYNPAIFNDYLKEKGVTHVVIDRCTPENRRAELVELVKSNSKFIAKYDDTYLYELNR